MYSLDWDAACIYRAFISHAKNIKIYIFKKQCTSVIQNENREFLSIPSMRKEVDPNLRGFETA